MPRPFFIALGFALVALWFIKRGKATAQKAAGATSTQPVPNQQGYDYPKTAARNAGAVKPAQTFDPSPTAQETEIAGIACADGTFRSFVDDPMYRQWDTRYEGNIGGDW
jgi:hypothetical protein